MDSRFPLGSVVATAILVAALAPAAAGGPSTPGERREVVRLAALLEERPLGAEARRARRWLDRYLVEVSDLRVPVCRNLLLPLARDDEKLARALVGQMLYSGAAFVIEHPEQADDDFAVYLAGVRGSLRVYESIVRERPRRRLPLLDHLLLKRDRGQLGRFVQDGMTTCRSRA